jgi:hypothetical protein
VSRVIVYFAVGNALGTAVAPLIDPRTSAPDQASFQIDEFFPG